jgi:hypothetical protein
LRTECQRIDALGFYFAAAPLFEGRVDATHHGFERDLGILPAFDKRPIERREQEQPRAARALEVLFNLGEIVEVVDQSARFRSQIICNPSSVRCSSSTFK